MKEDIVKSKTQQVAEILSFFKKGQFLVSKLAKTVGLAESTVVQIARLNPAQCSITDNDTIIHIIGDGGVVSTVGHNASRDGRPTSFRGERRVRAKYLAKGRNVTRLNNGTS